MLTSKISLPHERHLIGAYHHLNSENSHKKRDPNCETCYIHLDWVGWWVIFASIKWGNILRIKLFFWGGYFGVDLPWCWCYDVLGSSLSSPEVFCVPRRAARRTLAACNRCWRTEAEKRKKAFAVWSLSSLGFCTWCPGLDDLIWVWVKIGYQNNWMANTRLLDIY